VKLCSVGIRLNVRKPIIAITMGDATGIGPELVVKVLSSGFAHEICFPFVVGDPEAMRRICGIVGADLEFVVIEDLSEARFSLPMIDVLCPEGVRVGEVPFGRISPVAGKAAMLCLEKASELAVDGKVHGIVSTTLNKRAFRLAGYHYADELGYLSDLTGSQEPFILGVANSVWTVIVSGHVPFREIADSVKMDRTLRYIGKLYDALKIVGFAGPRIAVAALNVHAGEGGLYGREEIDEIAPAIRKARESGIDVEGPVSADTVFVRALSGEFDGVVFMYHDQANIARKLQPREKGAAIFMGLPVVCGTTSHGTAFDIAGKGVADPGSLMAALKYTVQFSSRSASKTRS
jgi:4-hydroxy-L-threonine phosphate dehydrogenase PdxA